MGARLAVLFHRDVFRRPPGIDLVRLRELTLAFRRAGYEAEIVAPVTQAGTWEAGLPVKPLAVLDQPGRYDLVKACYQQSILNLGRHAGPVVCRLVRVVDEAYPERDELFRAELLACQELISRRAQALAFNNRLNLERWRERYTGPARFVLTPTGCPAEIPPLGPSPYPRGERVVLFLGSVSAPHMAEMLNAAAGRLAGLAKVHLLGLNKTQLYGLPLTLDPAIILHPPRPEAQVWDFLGHAQAGLALATGPLAFDNDVSKVYNYLRAGLPVVCEEPILQAGLVRSTGLGSVFGHGDLEGLVAAARRWLTGPPAVDRAAVAGRMARDHSWGRRAEAYLSLFAELLVQAGD